MEKNPLSTWGYPHEMKKKLRRIRFTLLIMFLFCSLAEASSQKITLKVVNMNLYTALQQLKSQTEVRILYDADYTKTIKCNDITFHEEDLYNVLNKLLENSDLTYQEIHGTFVISKKQQKKEDERTRKITGTVKDKSGSPLPGVTVVIKGSSTGVSTDKDGNFSILPPTDKAVVLLFSFVGMETQEVECKNDQPLTIIMHESMTELEEVVVETGYQKLPRKDMVGSFTMLKADDIMLDSYSSIDQMLQGRVPGLVAVNTSSRVGRAPKITIRGTSTILGNSDPLWVVDGIIQPDPMPFNVNSSLVGDLSEMVGNQISWLNPNDIETVTILKDASATAVYGSKASNGVIVITTKKGQADRFSVRYSARFGVRVRPNYGMFDFMNSRERIHFGEEAYNAGVRYQRAPVAQIYTYEGLMRMLNERLITEDFYKSQVSWLETVNTDWFDLLTRNAFNNSHNLSISGGSQRTTYNASLSYYKNKGVEVGNDVDSFSARLSVNTKLSDRVQLDFTINGNIGNNWGYGPGVNPMSYARSTSRALPAFDQEGNPVYYKYASSAYPLNGAEQIYSTNIFNEMENSYSRVRSHRFDASINLNWKLFPGVDYQLVAGVSANTSNNEAYAGEKTSYIAENYRGYDYNSVPVNGEYFMAAMLPYGGELLTNDISYIDYNMQHRLLYSKEFNENHRLNVMVATELRSTINRMASNTVWGFVPERGELIMAPTALEDLKPINGGSYNEKLGLLGRIYNGQWATQKQTDNFVSFFATLAYSLKSRYTLNMNVRNDISNRFGQDVNKRFDPTYSFGFQWRMGEESFIKDQISWLKQVNMRATFGIQGNVVSNISPELIVEQEGILSEYKEYAVVISSLPNPLLKWERTKTWNVGLDFSLPKGITVNIEYYGRNSNAIVDQAIPHEYGLSTMKLNGGRIMNSGVEVSVNITPIKRDDMGLNISFNTSKNWNKAKTVLRNDGTETVTKEDFLSGSGSKLLKKGKPVSGFWSYSFAGLDPKEGYPLFNKLEYEVANKQVDPTTFLVYSGTSQPYFTGGLSTTFRYKSLTFSTSFNILLGAKKRLPNPYANFSGGKLPNPTINLSKELNDRWKQPGDELTTDIPALWTSVEKNINYDLPDGLVESCYSMWARSDNRVVDASFLRCPQMSLSWQMPSKLCRKFAARSFSVNVSASNIFVICSKKFRGFDPELGNSVMPRMFSFGFNVGF